MTLKSRSFVHRLLAFAAAAALTLALPPVLDAASPPAPRFSADRLHAHVQFLADDLLEGRETGTRGHEIAARYVASQFAAFGLEPGGDDGTWFQRVTFQQTSLDGRPALAIDGPAGSSSWPHGAAVMIRANPREPHVDVSGPLVFVGYGIENARLGIDDYRGLDVKGKIVVALRGFPRGLPSEEGAHASATKLQAAQRHGALAVLQVETLQSMKSTPWQYRVDHADDPDYDWVDTDGQPFVDAPELKVRAVLDTPAAKAAFAGARRSLDAVRKEADRVGGRPRGFALKSRARVQVSSRATRVTSPNVVALVRGSDPALSTQVVALSAHLDHLGIAPAKPGDPPGKDRIFNGALDNASGVATLLEVARAMATAPDRPRRSVLFIATTGEEEGLLGADYYARHPTLRGLRIVGNVDLDMPLLLYPFTDVIAFGANHSTFGRLVAEALAPMGIALAPDPMPEQGLFTRSDHYMFVKQGVPAVFLITGYANGGEKAWGAFMSGPYHHPDDDLSQPIDWASGARFVEANYRITRAMADADAPPLWLQGDFFGDTFAPDAARAPR